MAMLILIVLLVVLVRRALPALRAAQARACDQEGPRPHPPSTARPRAPQTPPRTAPSAAEVRWNALDDRQLVRLLDSAARRTRTDEEPA